jgi:hypothetical protein
MGKIEIIIYTISFMMVIPLLAIGRPILSGIFFTITLFGIIKERSWKK